MDATSEPRETRTVRIAGREMRMYVPTSAQALAISLTQSEQLDPGERMSILRELWFDLFIDRQDRVHFVTEMARRNLDAIALAEGLNKLLATELAQDEPGTESA